MLWNQKGTVCGDSAHLLPHAQSSHNIGPGHHKCLLKLMQEKEHCEDEVSLIFIR